MPSGPEVDEAVRARRRIHIQEMALPSVILALIVFGTIAGTVTDGRS